VVLDDQEDADLRATFLGALSHFPEHEAVRSDRALTDKAARLESESTSEHLRAAAAQFKRITSK
jgi:hypothetical protein